MGQNEDSTLPSRDCIFADRGHTGGLAPRCGNDHARIVITIAQMVVDRIDGRLLIRSKLHGVTPTSASKSHLLIETRTIGPVLQCSRYPGRSRLFDCAACAVSEAAGHTRGIRVDRSWQQLRSRHKSVGLNSLPSSHFRTFRDSNKNHAARDRFAFPRV